jgi:hypothetical protein
VARPIEPTPQFEGADASDLLNALDRVRLPESEKRIRVAAARSRVAELMRPKGYRQAATCHPRGLTLSTSK